MEGEKGRGGVLPHPTSLKKSPMLLPPNKRFWLLVGGIGGWGMRRKLARY